MITYNGETHSIGEWASIFGLGYKTLYNRLCFMSMEEAATKPIRGNKRGGERAGRPATLYEANGESRTLNEWAKLYNIPEHVLRERMSRKKISLEEALKMPYNVEKKYEYRGKLCPMSELKKIAVVPVDVIHGRLRNGWAVEDAVERPLFKSGKGVASAYAGNKGLNKCNRYDCLYQDGSGICKLRYKNQDCCHDNYKDAFEYYYGEEDRKREREKKPKNGIQYFGTGSAWVYDKPNPQKEETEKKDRWAQYRKVLLTGYTSY